MSQSGSGLLVNYASYNWNEIATCVEIAKLTLTTFVLYKLRGDYFL